MISIKHQRASSVAEHAVGGGHRSGGVAVVEELRQWFGAGRDVAVEDRVAAWGVGPVPVDEPFEEDADHPQPLPLGVLRQGRGLGPGSGGEPHLVVLEVASGDVGDDGHLGLLGEPAGQLTQRVVGGRDAARGDKG